MRSRRRRPVLGATITLALTAPLAAGLPAANGAAATASASAVAAECARALVIAVPGSGEGDAGQTGTAAMGRTLGPAAESILAASAAQGHTVDATTVTTATLGPGALLGRGRQSAPARDVVTRASRREWAGSVPTLTDLLWSRLRAASAACPDQMLYLLGYSQGAEAVHRVIGSRFDADLESRTVAVVLVGDSARRPAEGAAIAGDPAARASGVGVTAALATAPPAALPGPDWAPPVTYVCSRGDLVCDLSSLRFSTARQLHRSYGSEVMTGKLRSLGARLGRRLSAWPVPAEGQTVQGRAGLVLSGQLQASVAGDARQVLRWRATSALPPGLSLGNRGYVRGLPTAAGTFSVDYVVWNSSDESLSRPIAGRVTLTVAPPLSTHVSAGGRHTCAVRSDGTLWCWGASFYGQLGLGDKTGRSAPVQVGTGTNWADVSAGGMHTCAVKENGTLWCWGLNYRGQLGLGSKTDQVSPKRVGSDTDWASVSSGWVHTCGLKTDGTAWCWGNNGFGQLGVNDRDNRLRPEPVSGAAPWTAIESGGWHTCGIRTDGSGWCWGRNDMGQLGDGTRTLRIKPTALAAGTTWARLAPSWNHSCGISTTGEVSCWGSNEAGQLGTGDRAPVTSPTVVSAGRQWADVATANGVGCALSTDARLWCWGSARRYQMLGAGVGTSLTPIAVGTGTWAGLDLGWLHGCVTPASGNPTCWGNNETGELGTGGTAALAPGTPALLGSTTAGATSYGAVEPAASAAVPPARVVTDARRSAPRAAAPLSFTLVSFNVLGSNHTAPRADAGDFSPARVRSEWAVDYLRSVDASIVGFQEIQQDQLAWFKAAAGDQYDVWPGTAAGSKGVQTSVAWRSDAWRLVASDTVEIPFIQETRLMPLVRLESIETGRKIWVMNIHNAPRDLQKQRNVAVAREIKRLQELPAGNPVFLIGDFNERDRVFCQVTGKLDMAAPRGGSHVDGDCQPPSGRLRVDWIFGSTSASMTGYREDRGPLVARITDHAILRTTVSLG